MSTPPLSSPLSRSGANSPATSSTTDRPARKWMMTAGAVLGVLLAAGGGAGLGVYHSWNESGRIAPDISINGVSVGGLTPTEAKLKLQQSFGSKQVEIRTPDRTYTYPLAQAGGQPQWSFAVMQARNVGREYGLLGGAWSYWTTRNESRQLPLPLHWDKPTLNNTLQQVALTYRRNPEDARLRFAGGAIQVVGGHAGRALDIDATMKALEHQNLNSLSAVDAHSRSVSPRVAAADLQGRDVALGHYTTSFNAGLVGRTRNIHIASGAIEGTILMPGEAFSFNAATGERTWDKGYRMAHIFQRMPGQSEAQVVEGLAGGTCQVSSTLFNAIRKTNNQMEGALHILERNHHSLPVTYVPSGLDATVAWPYKDFRFRNSLSYPVYLRSTVSGARLTVSVWARVPNGVASPAVPTPSA